jgi:hypothetical protein
MSGVSVSFGNWAEKRYDGGNNLAQSDGSDHAALYLSPKSARSMIWWNRSAPKGAVSTNGALAPGDGSPSHSTERRIITRLKHFWKIIREILKEGKERV